MPTSEEILRRNTTFQRNPLELETLVAAFAANVSAPSNSVIVEIVAAEPITAYSVVTVDGYLADSADLSAFNRVLGVSNEAMATGFPVSVVQKGIVENPAWAWTTGDRIFLNGGSLSTTPVSSGFSQLIGLAKDSQTIVVECEDPIWL